MKVTKILKDLILSILIVTSLSLIVCLIFYNKTSLNKVIPESQEYVLSQKISDEIKSVNPEKVQEIVTKYYIDASELKKYEKTNEYNKGKKHPFSKSEESLDTNSNNNSIGQSNKNESNFYEDDGTK